MTLPFNTNLDESQKKTTDEYRKGWDAIFGKKEEKPKEDEKDKQGREFQ